MLDNTIEFNEIEEKFKDVKYLQQNMAKIYCRLASWLELNKYSQDEYIVLRYCRGLNMFDQIHNKVATSDLVIESETMAKLIAENNSFMMNRLHTAMQIFANKCCFIQDALILQNNANTYTYFHKWKYTSEIKYLIKSAEMKLNFAMLELIQIYMSPISIYKDKNTDPNYYLNQAVIWYGQLNKYYVNNKVLINFQLYITKPQEEKLKSMYQMQNNSNDNILGEYEIVCIPDIDSEKLIL